MTKHFELVQASKSQLLGAKFSDDGQTILDTECEFDQSKFIKLSSDSFLDLKGLQLEALKKVCLVAHKAEEFFLIINATNQWVRTVIDHKNLHPETWTETDRIIRSNILPYDPYWSQVGDGANRRAYFPSRLLEEAIEERKQLKAKLQEWMDSGKNCEIGTQGRNQQGISKWLRECWNNIIALVFKHRETKWFWEIQATDVKFERWISEPKGISQVTWRGGRFVRKETYSDHGEFAVVKRVNSHPNIVYGFGELCDAERESSSYFMEYMSTELHSLIVDRVTHVVGENEPPFSHHDSIDILLQFANGMRHMHQQGVVHCDLKSHNVLMSEVAVSDNAKHFLVKVADFGSARNFGNSRTTSSGFQPGGITDSYAAPEALQQLQQQIEQRKLQRQQQGRNMKSSGKSCCIRCPDRIDVFSFGIVAFEVLTGDIKFLLMQFPDDDFKKRCKSRKGVIEGTLRPPLRSKCLHNKEFIQDDELISLVERCWHFNASKRPSFVKICKDLNKAKVRILEKMSQNYPSPSQANSVNDPSSAPEVSSEGICDVNPQLLEHKRGWISASSCGIDHLFKSSGKFIVTVLLVMLAFMCLSSPIKETRVADLFKLFMALVLFAFIPYLIFWIFCGRKFLFVTRCRIRKFRAVIFKEKVKIE